MKCLNNKQILAFGLILITLYSITPISAENVKPSVEIGDELIYDAYMVGEFDEGYNYWKANITNIINETNDGMTNVLFDIYTSTTTTSWNDTPEYPDEDRYVLTNVTEIVDAIDENPYFPSILVKPGLKIGNFATELETLLTPHFNTPVTGFSINNSYGVRFEISYPTNNISLEYVYNEDGILLWCQTIEEYENSEDNSIVQLRILTINDVPIELNPTDTETTNTGTTDTVPTETVPNNTNTTGSGDTENPSNIPGYPFMTVIVIACVFIFLKHKKKYLNTL